MTKIYVADLAAYNSSILHGVWIDVSQDEESINEAIKTMLATSPIDNAEEWAIHDHEGFQGINISEHEGIEQLVEYATFLNEYPDFGGELLNHLSNNLDEANQVASDNYQGSYSSLADYAQELTEQTTEIPDNLAYYIDYEKLGRDMDMNGDIFTIEEGYQTVHVFWAH